jgi:stearoyl-CoA desaturase (delta-9 desaturase)
MLENELETQRVLDESEVAESRLENLDDKPESVSASCDDPSQRRLSRPPLVDERSRILWPYILVVLGFHLLVPLAFLEPVFSWWGLLWLPIGNYLFCSIGIGAGFHRLLTHRGYQCALWFEHFLAVLGCCNLQDSPVRWVLVHRIHHQHSDHEQDPHTPLCSWYWGHVGWLFIENRELTSPVTYDKYVRDMLRDPFYLRLERGLFYLWVYAIHAVLFAMVGFAAGYVSQGSIDGALRWSVQWLLWGVVYRTIYTWHVTWAVNSFTHLIGYRNYGTRENSRNHWLFALLTNGEGWHNNHHADPRSAAHGFHRWWELDVTYLTIRSWEKLGLVWDIVTPNAALLERRSKS